MAHPTSARARRSPSRWWYVVALAVFAVSLVPTYALGSQVARSIAGFEIATVSSDETVSVGDEQLAIFVRGEDAQAYSGTCTLTSGDGTTYDAPQPTTTMTINGWERIGLSSRNTPPGTYALRCPGIATQDLGITDNPDLAGGTVKGVLALASPALGLLIALAIAIITLVRRTNVRTRLRADARRVGG